MFTCVCTCVCAFVCVKHKIIKKNIVVMFKISVTLKSSVKHMYFHLLHILSSVKSRNDLSWLQLSWEKSILKK